MSEVVEITQADREAAADACEMLYSPTKITAMRAGKSDYGMVLFFARHRIASTPSGYQRGLEDAAKVAETWRFPDMEAMKRALESDTLPSVIIKQNIATAIRTLKESAR